ncbi:MAG TPA: ABC transporter permease [Flexilinea sp.]|jgi:peptide/nickel transport system permease protein|nr:ABC transporter permease [Flexilinea sp.]HOP02468.1 ABC transporter permease [Flexilinea sp.]HPJ64847.1 ABC transporter permease [Flexilinea sp.]HPR70835.1 ABC transporter permease [Flexilinea sp.]HPS48148.1 ABC transporter permease [Flexilinea sp.]
MRNYIFRRLLETIPTLLGISIAIFLIMHMIPGDTISALIGTQYQLTEAQAESLRAYYGLDKSLPDQYISWLLNALQGNFGLSVRTGQPVMKEILARFPLTFEITILTIILGTILGILFGIIAAVYRGSAMDMIVRIFGMVGLATPSFWLGTMIIYFLSVHFGIMLNAGNYVPFSQDPIQNLKQVLSPVICMGFSFSASVMRTTRSSLLEEINKEYALTSRAKGNKEFVTIFKHALRNALIPVITLVGYQIGYLFGGVVIIEQVFALPGLGRFLLNGISQRDYALVQGTILFIAANFVLVNLIADVAYGFADPRIRYD